MPAPQDGAGDNGAFANERHMCSNADQKDTPYKGWSSQPEGTYQSVLSNSAYQVVSSLFEQLDLDHMSELAIHSISPVKAAPGLDQFEM